MVTANIVILPKKRRNGLTQKDCVSV